LQRRQAAAAARRAQAARAPSATPSETESGGWASGGPSDANARLVGRSDAVKKRSGAALRGKDMQRVRAARAQAAAAASSLAGVGPRSEYAAPLFRRGGGGGGGGVRAPASALRAAGALRVGGIDSAAGAAAWIAGAAEQRVVPPPQRPVGLNLATRAARLPRLGPARGAAMNQEE
jgi:hypothetical protein